MKACSKCRHSDGYNCLECPAHHGLKVHGPAPAGSGGGLYAGRCYGDSPLPVCVASVLASTDHDDNQTWSSDTRTRELGTCAEECKDTSRWRIATASSMNTVCSRHLPPSHCTMSHLHPLLLDPLRRQGLSVHFSKADEPQRVQELQRRPLQRKWRLQLRVGPERVRLAVHEPLRRDADCAPLLDTLRSPGLSTCPARHLHPVTSWLGVGLRLQ